MPQLEKLELIAECDGRKLSCSFPAETCPEVKADFQAEGGRMRVVLTPQKALTLKRVSLVLPYTFTPDCRLFLNGYQSWTDSVELGMDDTMRGLRGLGALAAKPFGLRAYGDYAFAHYPDLHGFTYGYIRRDTKMTLLASLDEQTGFTILYFLPKEGKIVLEKDCAGICITQPTAIFDMYIQTGGERSVFSGWFGAMKLPALRAGPSTGYTTWYRHYQNISAETVAADLAAAKVALPHPRIFQLDDGWQTAVGDWTADKNKFPQDMAAQAATIRNAGMMPGLWLAPFACEKKSELVKQHPEWLLKDEKGHPLQGGSNWGGFYILDFMQEAVKQHLRKVFDTVCRTWGFGLVKLDFLYAVCLQPPPGKTRGGIMCEAMDFLRECAGDNLLLACGVPLGAAFGRADFCRIGCDVSLDWNDKWFMRRLHRERISTKNTIANTVYRRQLSGRVFWNDPDVFLLRDTDLALSNGQRRTLATVNCLLGGLLFTSDDLAAYTPEQREQRKSLMALAGAQQKTVQTSGHTVTLSWLLEGNRYNYRFDAETGEPV